MRLKILKPTVLNDGGNMRQYRPNDFVDVPPGIANQLIRVGHAEIADQPVEENVPEVRYFNEMTKSELVTFAEQHEIEVNMRMKKDEIIAEIEDNI